VRWLTFSIDLTSVKCPALLLISEDVIGSFELSEESGGLRIVVVGIRMELLCKLPERSLYPGRRRRTGNS
jgi:hypothetical protein